MEPKRFEQSIAINEQTYKQLRDEIRQNHAGEYVAMVDGKIITTAPTYDEALASVHRLDPMPECYFIFEADNEPIFDVVTDYFVGR